MAPPANSSKLAGIVIPKVTVASLAVYSVMGGIGYGLTHVKHAKSLGSGLMIAAFVGGGYALSHAIVTNISPEIVNGVDTKEL